MIDTILNKQLSERSLHNYFRNLVNQFFKILPLKENDEDTLPTYMRSLQFELLGFRELVVEIRDDQRIISLISILQYLIDHPEVAVITVRREVFKAISICNKLDAEYSEKKYTKSGGTTHGSMESLSVAK